MLRQDSVYSFYYRIVGEKTDPARRVSAGITASAADNNVATAQRARSRTGRADRFLSVFLPRSRCEEAQRFSCAVVMAMHFPEKSIVE